MSPDWDVFGTGLRPFGAQRRDIRRLSVQRRTRPLERPSPRGSAAWPAGLAVKASFGEPMSCVGRLRRISYPLAVSAGRRTPLMMAALHGRSGPAPFLSDSIAWERDAAEHTLWKVSSGWSLRLHFKCQILFDTPQAIDRTIVQERCIQMWSYPDIPSHRSWHDL